jgi:hypothetical protein
VLRVAVGYSLTHQRRGLLTFGERWFRGGPVRGCSRDSTAGCRPRPPTGQAPGAARPVHGPGLLSARRGLLATAAVLGGTAYDSLSGHPVRGVGHPAAPDLWRTGLLGVGGPRQRRPGGGDLGLAVGGSGPRRGRRSGAVPAAHRRGVPRRSLLLVTRPRVATLALRRPARHRRELVPAPAR